MRALLIPAVLVGASCFAACNAQPASESELAELEAEQSALEEAAPDEADPSDEVAADDEAIAAAADERDDRRNAHAEPDDPDKVDEAMAEAPQAAVPAGDAPLTLTADGARAASVQLGRSTTVTAPTVQLRVGHPTPTSPRLEPRLQPTQSLQLDLSATGTTTR